MPDNALLGDTLRVSERFNAKGSDIKFISSDNVIFRVHKKYLEVNSAAFPPAAFEVPGKIVPLVESSTTLELLFQFVYPQRQPDLSTLAFEFLALLAETAEKYEVFPAIGTCRVLMRNTLPSHPYEILEYATKHGYNEIIAETIPLLLDVPLNEIVVKLPNHLVVPWVLYHESWSHTLREAASFHKRWVNVDNKTNNFGQKWRKCKHCSYNLDICVSEITEKMVDVRYWRFWDLIFMRDPGCKHSKEMFQAWRASVDRSIKAIKPFSEYLNHDDVHR